MDQLRFPKADDKVTASQEATVALPKGSLVRYYDEGWRTGHIEEIIGKIAKIKPIAGYKAANPRCVKIPIGDVELV